MDDMDNLAQGADICRICRSEGMPERPLFHPCICTGSIKYIHQECLDQWTRYSRKEYCELCSYRFSFKPIYAPDMPRRLPIKDVAAGISSSILTDIKYWLHFTLVGLAWLCVVPYTACQSYRSLFNRSGSFDAVMPLPFDMWPSKNLSGDIFHGYFVITCTLFAFIGFMQIREHLLDGEGPDWLERYEPNNQQLLNLFFPPIPEENPVEDGDGEVRQENGNQVGHWNHPLNWVDRAIEDLTLERFLGLDGSLIFLNHVFLVMSINSLLLFVFAFCPYQFGNLAITAMSLQDKLAASHFEGLVTTLCGYCLIGMHQLIMHKFATIIGFRPFKLIFGHAYIFVKVFLIFVVEIGVSSLLLGWWLDICSLSLFDKSFKDRLASLQLAPGASTFIHWLVGAVCICTFASFVELVREVVRPGVIWFLKSPYNRDISPIQELIQLGMLQHGERIIGLSMILCTTVFLAVWLPIRILKFIWPSFLPYNVTLHSDSVKNFPMELLLFNVILPLLLKQTRIRNWLKMGIRFWCVVVSHILGMKSYLLEDGEEPPPVVALIHPPAADLGAAHEGLLRRGGPVGFQPYTRPTKFSIRLIALLALVALSVVVISLSVITVPVWLGRLAMSFWPALLPTTPEPSQSPNIHELFTAACGTYICWLSVQAVCIMAGGRTVVINRLIFWLKIGSKAMVAFIVLLGIIPFLFGLLLELAVVVPFQVPLHQTPVLWAWQDWALGMLYTIIACVIILMGPDWSLRRAIERTYRDGFMHLDLKLMMQDLAKPVIFALSLSLALPYVIAYSVVPLVVKDETLKLLIACRIYPTFMLMMIIIEAMMMQVREFKRLYKRIKHDKYLVGRRLVNYNHTRSVLGQN